MVYKQCCVRKIIILGGQVITHNWIHCCEEVVVLPPASVVSPVLAFPILYDCKTKHFFPLCSANRQWRDAHIQHLYLTSFPCMQAEELRLLSSIHKLLICTAYLHPINIMHKIENARALKRMIQLCPNGFLIYTQLCTAHAHLTVNQFKLNH